VEEFGFSWPETEKLLGRSQSSIEKARNYHGLKKKRREHISWTPERIELVVEHHYKSLSLHSQRASQKLKDTMIDKVNTLPGPSVNINAIKMLVRSLNKGSSNKVGWGYGGRTIDRWSEEKQKLFKELFEVGVLSIDIAKNSQFLEDFKDVASVSNKIRSLGKQLECNNAKRVDSISLAKEKVRGKQDNVEEIEKKLTSEEILENLPLESRNWNDPEVFEIDKNSWDEKHIRIGLISGIAQMNEGFRAGLIRLAFEKLRDASVRFVIFNGLLVDKRGFQIELKQRIELAKEEIEIQKKEARERGEKTEKVLIRDLKETVATNLVDESAKALSALIPRLRKPRQKGAKTGSGKISTEYGRIYIMTSPAYDGPYGEQVAKKLQTLRPEDIRLYNPGGDWLKIKQIDKVLGVLNPQRNRMPSQYHSNAPEKEIRDKEGQTSHDYPDLWGVGPFASLVYTPDGIRERPYFTFPGLRSIEEVYTAENQVGVSVLEYDTSDDLPSLCSWSFRDLIKNERSFINAPRSATSLQKNIVELIKDNGAQSIGLLADRFPSLARSTIEKEIEGLLVEDMSKFKTWPGLFYDEESQRYNFKLNWIQEKLRYVMPASFEEDRMLFFGCMHAGYTTTDYKHITNEYHKIIISKKIKHVFGLGDWVAGMKHDLPHSGEVIAGTGYTDHERFAAELMATIIFKVFVHRFEEQLQALRVSHEKISAEKLAELIHESLVYFYFIMGNHDGWQIQGGHIPLEAFENRLLNLLVVHIGIKIEKMNLPFVNILDIVGEHIIHYPDCEAICTLPSGLNVGMIHPWEGGAKTTTLKLQEIIGSLRCQIWGVANYHRASMIRMWRPDLGELVGIMAGAAGPIYTFFERRHKKFVNDFGPIYLRTLSHRKRIIMSEIAYFNRPYLKEKISKYTIPDDLKKELGLLNL